jgi:hypothetical protein
MVKRFPMPLGFATASELWTLHQSALRVARSTDTSMLDDNAQAFFFRTNRSLLHLCRINAR